MIISAMQINQDALIKGILTKAQQGSNMELHKNSNYNVNNVNNSYMHNECNSDNYNNSVNGINSLNLPDAIIKNPMHHNKKHFSVIIKIITAYASHPQVFWPKKSS